MELKELTQRSTLPPYVELFEIDCTDIPGLGAVYRYTPNVNYQGNIVLLSEINNLILTSETGETLVSDYEAGIYSPIVFGSENYLPFPIEIKGYNQSTDGAPARPTLSVSNINKVFGLLSFQFGDLIGAKVTYYRTFSDYLNLPTKKSAAPLKFTIARKSMHNMNILSYELRSPLDKERAMLPKRQMLKIDFPGLGINKVF